MTVSSTDQVLWSLNLIILVLLGTALVFICLTFILRWKNHRESCEWNRLMGTWEPTLLDALVDPGALQALWSHVGKGDQLRFLEFLLQYAQRLEGSEREILKRAAAPYLQAIVPDLDSARVSRRAGAVQTLGTLGLPEFLPELKGALADKSSLVAAIAGRLLAQDMGAAVAQDLCRSLDRFGNFRSRYLVDMLVGMGPGAVPALRATMEDSSLSPRFRAMGADALGALGDLGSADKASELAKEGGDPELITSLLRLLGSVGTSAHAPAARAHLASEPFFVRAAAANTISELGGEEDLPLLTEMVKDPSAWVKLAAARGIYRLGGKSALNRLAGPDEPAGALFRQVLAEEGPR